MATAMTSASSSNAAVLRAEVTVTAFSRLHLGFMHLGGAAIRQFGSIGLCLDAYPTRVSARALHDGPSRLCTLGPDLDRAQRIWRALEESVTASPAEITLASTPPAHAGLGSGTQLALALGRAFATLHQLPWSARDVAIKLGRGRRSGIGLITFDHGGFVVDGGRRSLGEHQVPPQLVRMAFPAQWCVILVLDSTSRGLSGDEERRAFTSLLPQTNAQSAALCQLVMMELLPALVEENFSAFAAALQRIQDEMGDYFSPAQGGRYTSPRVEAYLMTLQRQGVACVGQTSWGPTGFALLPSAQAAANILVQCPPPDFLTVHCCQPRNAGAMISFTD